MHTYTMDLFVMDENRLRLSRQGVIRGCEWHRLGQFWMRTNLRPCERSNRALYVPCPFADPLYLSSINGT